MTESLPPTLPSPPSVSATTTTTAAETSKQQSELTHLKALALKAYSQKNYSNSADLYAQACELQSTLQGEDNPRNAHLLYLYGRALFQVALTKSDVLGGGAAAAGAEEKKKEDASVVAGGSAGGVSAGGGGKAIAAAAPAPAAVGGKPGFFSFTGDENWDDTDDDEDNEDNDDDADGDDAKHQQNPEGEEEEEDDFTLTWQILDYARILFTKLLSTEAEAEETKSIKTTLSDTLDLLGEVSLESESFAQAARDLRSALELKLELYSQASTIVTEAHFKLSLALEFAAAEEGVEAEEARKGREEAAVEMERAIESCRARISKEEEEAKASITTTEEKEKETTTPKPPVTKSLEDAREMVAELQQRLQDLRTSPPPPPTTTTSSDLSSDTLSNLLATGDPAEVKRRLEEAISGARDLSGLVRKGGKRKLEEVVEGDEEEKEEGREKSGEAECKKARVEEGGKEEEV